MTRTRKKPEPTNEKPVKIAERTIKVFKDLDTINNKEEFFVHPAQEIKAVVCGIYPAGADSRFPHTRYKLIIEGEQLIISENLVKMIFKKKEEKRKNNNANVELS